MDKDAVYMVSQWDLSMIVKLAKRCRADARRYVKQYPTYGREWAGREQDKANAYLMSARIIKGWDTEAKHVNRLKRVKLDQAVTHA